MPETFSCLYGLCFLYDVPLKNGVDDRVCACQLYGSVWTTGVSKPLSWIAKAETSVYFLEEL